MVWWRFRAAKPFCFHPFEYLTVYYDKLLDEVAVAPVVRCMVGSNIIHILVGYKDKEQINSSTY